ncbi:hypothetical protein MVEN_00800500 [Mycena venus]|uniref:Uncharacterized protein n=1 Tax=Mycena venus TaxID=2733690 RepID=A0A8H7D626_9AGAR|nr:hypothetical protein MVEN_00800500 [Mycena venus]
MVRQDRNPIPTMFANFFANAFLLLVAAQGVLSAPQIVNQCGPGLYDPKCPPSDICCNHGTLGNICQPKTSDITCPPSRSHLAVNQCEPGGETQSQRGLVLQEERNKESVLIS